MANEAENYTDYQAEDFAQDDGFIRWIKQPDSRSQEFWEQWLHDHPEKSEEVDKARRLVNLMQAKEQEPTEVQVENMWRNVASGMEEGTKVIQLHPTSFLARHGWKVAAIVALMIGVFFVLWNRTETISAEYGQQLTYTLPDGSSVILNAGSEISFQHSGWINDREVQVEGEAFFEVEKGSPFEVTSALGTVEVLGTSFNVYAREEKFSVACFTGKVKVSDEKGQDAHVLIPGKGVETVGNQTRLYDFEPQKEVAWRQGEFVFENVPLRGVLDELQRQYDLEIDLRADIEGRNYTGQFNNNDLQGALQMICLPMELAYKLEENGKKVIIQEEE